MTHDRIFDELHKQFLDGVWAPGQRLPTERALADSYGVSRPTISRVLNRLRDGGFIRRVVGSGSYALETVGAIRPGPRSLGLLVPGLGQGEIFEPICARIAERSHEFDCTLTWNGVPRNGGVDIESQLRRTAEQIVARGVAGVFLQPLERVPGFRDINRRIAGLFESARIPLVLLDCDYLEFPDSSNHDLVGIDNVRAAYALTSHFIEQECRRVDFVWQPNTAGTLRLRLIGYRQALQDARIAPSPTFEHEGDARRVEFARRMVDAGARNIICENDETAALLMHTLEQIGLRVPADVRIAGFDDVKYAHLARVPLTTVRQPCQALGDLALSAMLERIADPALPPRNILAHAPLCVRASSKMPR